MMNARVLELIKNPKLTEDQDLALLNSVITEYPYIQSVRSIQLHGIHKFRPDDYQNELSETAAYTTDKKILYQFINRKSEVVKEEKVVVKEEVQNVSEPILKVEEAAFTEVLVPAKPASKPIYLNGQLNRILFEGEEDFLERENYVIDAESTKEAGTIVIQRAPKQDISETKEEQLKPEIIEEDKVTEEVSVKTEGQSEIQNESETPANLNEVIPTEKSSDKVENEVEPENTEVSFHETENFLPAVKLTPTVAKTSNYKVPAPQTNRHEEEMQRLIAEVEAKMRTKKNLPKEEEPTSQNTDVNFSDVQAFDIELKKPEINPNENEDKIAESKNRILESTEPRKTDSGRFKTKKKKAEDSKDDQGWKPMGFSGNTPDSLIGSEPLPKENKKQQDEPASPPEITPEVVRESDEKPIFNISFFSQKVASLETEKANHILEEVRSSEKPLAPKQDSNVPVFINTWQNWLKIERKSASDEAKTDESKEREKSKVIETFIAKEPRISKLKEESGFVVKEKSDNISHLMTETLAKLYTEQKLYAKAIKAYHTLSEKHPEKKSAFDEEIARIKDLRQNK